MIIKIDYREKDLIELFKNNQLPDNITYTIENFNVGDIIIENEGNEIILIERKTLKDLACSIKDKRYAEQSMRLQHLKEFHNHNIIYLIEGCFKFYDTKYTNIHINTLISAMTTLHYYKGFSVFRTMSLQETFDFITNYSNKIFKSKDKEPYYNKESKEFPTNSDYVSVIKKEKKANITPTNIGHIMLSQIPGVSIVYANGILENFSNIQEFIEKFNENPDIIKNLKYTTKTGQKRNIPSSCIININTFLLKTTQPIINIDT
jgi:ERCC4-type nuclease